MEKDIRGAALGVTGGNYHLPACLGLGVSCVASGVAFQPYVAMVILLLFF